MEKCIWREPVRKHGKDSMSSNIRSAGDGVIDNVFVSGKLKQTFSNGLCTLLTANDIGPLECRRPECNEKNCPDIADLRKQLNKQLIDKDKLSSQP
jgi:hypothetical protein